MRCWVCIIAVMCVMLPANAQENGYVGSDGCGMCHPDQKALWMDHGHASMLRPVENGAPPEGAATIRLPAGESWATISYLIGGATYFGRFTDSNGYVMTGDAVQYSMPGDALTAFYPEVPNHTRQYDCIRCHVVGWKAEGEYDSGVANDLEGIPGVWFENGVGCEACHGPGHLHAAAGPANLRERQEEDDDMFIASDASSEMCGQCHKRTQDDRLMLVADDLVRSRQQYTEMLHNRKSQFGVTCVMCHNPHASAEGDGGMRRSCLTCHTGQFAMDVQITAMNGLSCTDCHMPDACRGAYDSMTGEYHQGDTPSHIFGITVDPAYRLDDGTGYASLDDNNFVRLTVEMTCYACHKTGRAMDLTREQLLEWGARVHVAD